MVAVGDRIEELLKNAAPPSPLKLLEWGGHGPVRGPLSGWSLFGKPVDRSSQQAFKSLKRTAS